MYRASEISSMLAERAEQVCSDLLPASVKCGNEIRVGNVTGDPGQSLQIRLDGDWRGRWKDFATDQSGDLLDLVRLALGGVTTQEAMAWATRWLGVTNGDGHPVAETRSADASIGEDSKVDDGKRIEAARKIWRQSVPIKSGDPVDRYLRGRGLKQPYPPTLKIQLRAFHCRARCELPALVAAISAWPSNKVAAVQRTFLTPDGRKAEGEPVRMTSGVVKGGAVRLAAAGKTLAVAEGVETALAYQQLHSTPTWATLGTSGMRRVVLPDDLDQLVIAADHDAPGLKAATELKQRTSRRTMVGIAVPPAPLDDWNDHLLESVSDARRCST